jgi:hypothetical protein
MWPALLCAVWAWGHSREFWGPACAHLFLRDTMPPFEGRRGKVVMASSSSFRVS